MKKSEFVVKNELLDDEIQLIENLRHAIRLNASAEFAIENTGTEKEWSENVNRLYRHIMNDDPRKFLTWGVVLSAMFVADQPYIPIEFGFLKRLPDWRKRWSKAVRESPFGQPIYYPNYKKSSENLIHHAYHIAQWEKFAGIQVEELDIVLEFGGGYGSMARLFYNLGFRGTYVIYDLPIVSALQRYFLESLGINVISDGKHQLEEMNVFCTSSLGIVKNICSFDTDPKKLFIATWSLSESPIAIRFEWSWVMNHFSYFLLAYQEQFGGVDNQDYFSEWTNPVRQDIHWSNWNIEHLPGNFYLMGKK